MAARGMTATSGRSCDNVTGKWKSATRPPAAFFRMSRSALSFVTSTKPIDLELLGLHLPMSRERPCRRRSKLLHPFAQHVLVDIEVPCRWAALTPRSRTSRTASTLNSRLNFRLSSATSGVNGCRTRRRKGLGLPAHLVAANPSVFS